MFFTYNGRCSVHLTVISSLLYWMTVNCEDDLVKNTADDGLCQSEYFAPECDEHEVIVIQKALYGRMTINRCVKENFGYVGCSRDVVDYLDALCSGRRSCKVRVLDATFEGIRPCHDDLKSYLYVTYSCIPVFTRERSMCRYYKPLELSYSEGYIASLVAEESGCGSADAPWIIKMEEGQKISVILYDFALRAINTSNTEPSSITPNSKICRVYATIREATNTRSVTVCGGNSRIRHVYTSVTNQIELRILNSKTPHEPLYFLFKYEAIGCPSITPPTDGWVKQTGNNAYIGCDNIPTTWRLYCNETLWVGEKGNCTLPEKESITQTDKKVDFGIASLSMDLSIILVITMALAIGLLILLTGLYCMRRQFSSDPNDHPSPSHYKAGPFTHTSGGYYPTLQRDKNGRPDVTSVSITPCRECTYKENEYASMRLLSLYDHENHCNLNRDSNSTVRHPTEAGDTDNSLASPTLLAQYKPSEQCASCSVADSGISSECCCHQYFDFDPEAAMTLQRKPPSSTVGAQSTYPMGPSIHRLNMSQVDAPQDRTLQSGTTITSKSIDSLDLSGNVKLSSQCSS